MKTIGSCFAVGFRLAVFNGSVRRGFASEVQTAKQPKYNPLDSIKPHERTGVLAAVEKTDAGFPSYMILKDTSPLLRLVSNTRWVGLLQQVSRNMVRSNRPGHVYHLSVKYYPSIVYA